MKKNIIVLLIAAIIMPLFIITNSKLVEAEGLDDVSFSKGYQNMLDPDILEYDGNGNISSNKYTYVRYGDAELIFQMEKSYIFGSMQISLELLDSNLDSLMYTDSVTSGEFVGSDGTEWCYIKIYVLEETFAFKISSFTYFEEDIETDGFPIMCYINVDDEYFDRFYEFIPAEGYFDMTDNPHPTIETSYSNVLSIDDIKSLITAYDGYDGNITNMLTIDASDYLDHSNTIGTYTVNAEVSDSSNNHQEGYFYIKVSDKISPSIFGLQELSFEVNNDITDEIILSNYTATDEYDGDVTSSLRILTSHTTRPTTVFNETITIEAEDANHNRCEIQVLLKYIDNTKPLITGPESLTTSYRIVFSNEDILNLYSVSDNVDNNLTITIAENKYKGKERIVGSYEITLSSTDLSGNEALYNITVTVEDNIPPVIMLNRYILEVTDSVALQNVDFIDLLYASGELSSSKQYNEKVLKDTYTGHENEEGQYIYEVLFEAEDGEKVKKSFQINVLYNSYEILPKENIETINFGKTLIWFLGVGTLIILFVGGLIIIFDKKTKIINKN